MLAVEETAVPGPGLGENPYQPHLARIVRVYRMVPDNHLFTLRLVDPRLADGFQHRPGQFLMLSVPGVGEAPISISSSPSRPGILELCIRRAGRVTNALYRMQTNDVVGIRGPYGNGFPVEVMAGSDILFVAGGLGMAPLRSLVWYALDHRDKFGNITLMYGSKTPADMLFREELVSLVDRTDMNCLLPHLFDHARIDAPRTYAAVCGPPVVYKYVLRRLLDLGFSKDRILMSLERRMKCGVGKCNHCCIGFKYTCLNGPIFTYWDAINLPEMI